MKNNNVDNKNNKLWKYLLTKRRFLGILGKTKKLFPKALFLSLKHPRAVSDWPTAPYLFY